jgi:hypothetical protein
MANYTEADIKHETAHFWVLDAGRKGFQVFQTGITHSTLVASIGRSIGLQRAIDEAECREARFIGLQLSPLKNGKHLLFAREDDEIAGACALTA